MSRPRWSRAAGLSLALALAGAATVPAQVPPRPPAKDLRAAARPDPAAREAAVEALARRIDRRLEAVWKERGIVPAEPVGDAEFLRRVYLDTVGRIPRVGEARAFLADPDPGKRAKWVKRLLESAGYANHFSAVTRDEWFPGTTDDFRVQFAAIQVENWLRDRFRENTPYDEMVRDLLLAPVNDPGQERFRFDASRAQAAAFFQANENKPEEVASAAARLFLGVKLECAQCHDHPFAPYTREQFWEFAAFFGDVQPGLPRPRPGRQEDFERLRETRIPNTNPPRTVTARYFDGTEPDWKPDQLPREALVEWLVRAENPYFARNAANRVWEHFFGVGIIDPVDEPGEKNPPSHPELLDDLAGAFVESGYDLKFLAEAIVRSRAYQLSSRQTHSSQAAPQTFARMAVKGMTPEQFFDSLAAATGFKEPPGESRSARPFQVNTPRGQFLNRFTTTERPTEAQTSILQALMLMNGPFVADQTSLEKSETLAAVLDMPFATTPDRIEALFLAALGRTPTPEEAGRFAAYVESGGPAKDPNKALGDVFWALLNSTEFMVNH
ncbi:MAG TPA: DUF1549 and DUF1553 domain-containing protein [Gemmataceae bacterium]